MSTSRASHVFISYSRVNIAFVNRLIDDLQRQGITVWVDQSGLTPGTPDWETALRAAISRAHAVILIASEEARKSPYVKDELRLASEVYKLPIYPIWVAGKQWINCIPLGWGGTQYVDARGDEAHYQLAVHKLVAALNGVQTMTSMMPVPVASSATYASYAGQSSIYTPSSIDSSVPGRTQPARPERAVSACLVATLVSLLLVGVLFFALAIPFFNFVSHLINNPTNPFPSATASGFPTSTPPVLGELSVTPRSFNITPTGGSSGGCDYYPGSFWICLVTIRNVSNQGQLSWSATATQDSITFQPGSASNVPIEPGQSQQIDIQIPASFCGHAVVTFKGSINSVDVPINCS